MADSSRRSTRFSARSKLLCQLLLENGDVRAEQIAQALKLQEQQGGPVGQILQDLDACSAQAIAAALLKQVQVTDIRCEELQVRPEVAELVPRELCEAERLCPFERLGGLLCLVMGNPLNRKAILQIEERARLKVKSFKAPWPKILELIQRTYEGEGPALPERPAGAAVPEGLKPGAESVAGDDELAPPMALEEPQPAEEAPLAEAPPEEEAPATEALPDEGALPADDLRDRGTALAEEPQPAAEPQAVEAQQPESWEEPAPAGIVPVPESLLSGSGARRVREPEPPPVPKVEGLENLDESHAEMVETRERGLGRRGRKAEAPAAGTAEPQPEPKAKINVDLDRLDFSAAEAVAVEARGEEAMEKVAPAAPASPPSTPGFTKLETVPDSYFFEGGSAPAAGRPEELLDLLGSLPIAETVARSIDEYESQIAPQAAPAAPAQKPAVPAAKPTELGSTLAAPAAALPISEADFHQAAVAMVEDPVGEWEWEYTAAGPLEVVDYEEN